MPIPSNSWKTGLRIIFLRGIQYLFSEEYRGMQIAKEMQDLDFCGVRN